MRPKNTGKTDPRKIILPKEELYQKYIVENMPRKECAKFFNVTERTLVRRLGELGIKRAPGMTYLNRKKAMLEKYGVEHAILNGEFNKKRKKTMLERYGVEYTAQSPELQAKMQATMIQRYGKNNYVETNSFQEKSTKTCLNKYGVEHPCQYPQCIKALEDAIGHSKPEQEFSSILDKYNISYEREYSVRGFKYDFKIGNILIEIDPSATHNSNFGIFGKNPKDKMYHYTKYSVAKEFGFHCIHIFDWDDMEKIVKTFLLSKERIYARNCEVREVPVAEAKQFINENHLQGYAKDNIRLGLYYNNELVMIMTFDKPRYNKNYEYELIRLCGSKNVVGGNEKLFHEFINKFKPQSIISYCDLSKFSGDVYNKLGFKVINRPKPSKHWFNLKTKEHVTDNLLREKGFDQLFKTSYGKGTSNEELMLEHDFVEVYDCGQLAFGVLLS